MASNGYYKNEAEKKFLGTGLAFPFQLNPTRHVKLVSGIEDIEQAIRIILGTAPGERLMRPEFGCRAHELIFAPHDTATEALLVYYVEEALARWEPRIVVEQITVEAGEQEGVLVTNIQYSIKATHDERSIVFPFYIMDEM